MSPRRSWKLAFVSGLASGASPQTPTGALPLDPAGDGSPQTPLLSPRSKFLAMPLNLFQQKVDINNIPRLCIHVGGRRYWKSRLTTFKLLCIFINYPAPGRGRGIVFGRFLSLFLFQQTLRENGWIDLHQIFRECVEWPWNDLIKFWVNSGKRVGGSKVNLFVISGHSSEDWR